MSNTAWGRRTIDRAASAQLEKTGFHGHDGFTTEEKERNLAIQDIGCSLEYVRRDVGGGRICTHALRTHAPAHARTCAHARTHPRMPALPLLHDCCRSHCLFFFFCSLYARTCFVCPRL